MRELSGIQYMRALALFITTESLSLGNPAGFDPNQKRNLNPKRKVKTRLSVDRPMPRSTAPVDRLQPRLDSFQSIDRAVDRFHATINRAIDRSAFVHLVHTGRPSDRPAACCMRRFSLLCLPISVLSSSISSSSLPTIIYLGEDFSNLSRSPTNSSLSPGKIDTRSRLGICSSAINWNAPYMRSHHFSLGEISYMPITERVSHSATS